MTEENIAAKEPGKWRQLIASIIVCLAPLASGICVGWASPTLPQLGSKDTPVGSEPLTEEQLSWLPSMMCIGCLVAAPFTSVLSEKLGRKTAGCLVAIPTIISWLLKIFATNFLYLMISQFLTGVTWTMAFFVAPLYITEIAADSIRGQLGSLVVIGLKGGTLIGYGLGAILTYRNFAICALIVPIIFGVGFFCMPETPVYLVRKQRYDDARRSLMWLKCHDKATVDNELSRLRTFVDKDRENKKNIGIKDLFRDRETIMGLIINLGILTGQQLNGIPVVLVYISTIFALTESTLSPNTSAVIVGVMQLFGTCLSFVVMDRTGRRSLILMSCFGMAVCHCALATYFLFQNYKYDVSSFNWIPILALSCYAVAFSVGLGPASYVVSAEVLRPDISSLIYSLSLFALNVASLIITKFFPSMSHLIGVYGCFYIYAIFCICIFTFTYVFVPETKGRSVESILKELSGR